MRWIKPYDDVPQDGQDVLIVVSRFNREQLVSEPQYLVATYREPRIFVSGGLAYIDTEILDWTPIVAYKEATYVTCQEDIV